MRKIKVKKSNGDISTYIKSKKSDARLIIQIEKPNSNLELKDIKEILNHTGVKLDESYGPYSINKKLGRYIVRGTANSVAQKKLRNIPGIKIFLDKKIELSDK